MPNLSFAKMMMKNVLLITILLASFSNPAVAQKNAKGREGASLDNAISEVYKTVGDVKLNIYRFYPQEHKDTDQRPAVVFFFGGGWKSGDPKQFANQCAHLANRGMVAMTAEYRVYSRHRVKAVDCVEDAKSAIRWVRANAARLGIDPNRIAAGGGSAGGHLAACAGVVPGFERSSEDTSVSSVPNALILFNPALVLANIEGKELIPTEKLAELRQRIGVDPQKVSPFHHVQKGNPPTIIFHGRADTTVPYRSAQSFADAMIQHGNRCELVGFDGQGHGFFNYGRDGNEGYRATLAASDQFLVSLGYLAEEPAIQPQKK
jgi:acetyl esterase